MVEDVLCRMTMVSVSHVEEEKKKLVKYVHRLDSVGVRLEDSPNGGFMVHHNSDSLLVVEVKSKQHFDPLLMELKESVLGKVNESRNWYLVSSMSHSPRGIWFLCTKGDYVYLILRI